MSGTRGSAHLWPGQEPSRPLQPPLPTVDANLRERFPDGVKLTDIVSFNIYSLNDDPARKNPVRNEVQAAVQEELCRLNLLEPRKRRWSADTRLVVSPKGKLWGAEAIRRYRELNAAIQGNQFRPGSEQIIARAGAIVFWLPPSVLGAAFKALDRGGTESEFWNPLVELADSVSYGVDQRDALSWIGHLAEEQINALSNPDASDGGVDHGGSDSYHHHGDGGFDHW